MALSAANGKNGSVTEIYSYDVGNKSFGDIIRNCDAKLYVNVNTAERISVIYKFTDENGEDELISRFDVVTRLLYTARFFRRFRNERNYFARSLLFAFIFSVSRFANTNGLCLYTRV